MPDDHPGRLTSSWITAARDGVRWSAPACPIVDQAAGSHGTEAIVRVHPEMLPLLLRNVGALSIAWPWIKSEVVSDWASSTANWTQALVMVAPCGTATPRKRTPTFWMLLS